MSKYSIKELWNERFGKQDEVYDYADRLMLKSACGNHNSSYQPTIDHIRPLSAGGKDTKENIIICHFETNEENRIASRIGKLTIFVITQERKKASKMDMKL